MKLAVVAGVHPKNEPYAIEIAKAVKDAPGVTSYLFNYRGLFSDRNQCDLNGAMAFDNIAAPETDPNKNAYERQRASIFLWVLMHGRYDVIIDLHTSFYDENTTLYGNLHARSGREAHIFTSPEAIATGAMLGFERIILTQRSRNLGYRLPNVIGTEISPDDQEKNDPTFWRKRLGEIATMPSEDLVRARQYTAAQLQFFKTLEVVGLADQKRCGMDLNMGCFKPVPVAQASAFFGHSEEKAYTTCWGDKYPVAGELIKPFNAVEMNTVTQHMHSVWNLATASGGPVDDFIML